jgi:hypothetical protein
LRSCHGLEIIARRRITSPMEGYPIMEKPGLYPHDLRRAFRIAWWGGAGVAAIAYAVLVPLKWHGLLEPKMTWSRIVIGPAILVLTLPFNMWATSQPRKKMYFWLFAWPLTILAIIALLSLVDPSCP